MPESPVTWEVGAARLRARVARAASVFLLIGCTHAGASVVDLDLGSPSPGPAEDPPRVAMEAASTLVARPPSSSDAAPIAFVPWSDDVLERAHRARRPILLVVCAAWAARCQGIERDLLDDPAVRRMARAYVPAWLDATDTSADMDARVRSLHVTGFPAIVLIDARDDAHASFPASLSALDLARELDTFARRG